MSFLREIVIADPNTRSRSGRLGGSTAESAFLRFGPDQKRTLIFGVFVVTILLWYASVALR